MRGFVVTRTARARCLMVVATLCIALPAAAATPEQKCQSSKNKAAGKYAACLQSAAAKFALKPDVPAHTAAVDKCIGKLDGAWAKAEATATAAGAACLDDAPSAADFKALMDTVSEDMTTALAGGALEGCGGGDPDCETDLQTCSDTLDTCSSDLSSCNGDLDTCDSNYSSCSSDLTGCNDDLDTCDSSYSSCSSNLSGCNDDLDTCDSNYATCSSDLTQCEAGFDLCCPDFGAEIPGDGIDQDCNQVDTCYTDADGDGLGTPVLIEGLSMSCDADAGRASNDDDCDDADNDPFSFHGAPEICDGYRNNCDDPGWTSDDGLVTHFTSGGAAVDVTASFRAGSYVVPSGGQLRICPGTYVTNLYCNGSCAELTSLAGDGSDAAATVLDGNQQGSVVDVGAGSMLIRSLTLTNGAASSGGGISFHFGHLQVFDSIITGNYADEGGGIYANFSLFDVELVNTSVSGNTALVGGGLYAFQASFACRSTTGTGVNDNTAGEAGGGAYLTSAATLRNAPSEPCTWNNNSPDDIDSGQHISTNVGTEGFACAVSACSCTDGTCGP